MKHHLRNTHQIVRYIAIGGAGFLLEVAVLYVCRQLGINPVAAVTISFIVGLVATFILQKFITFQDSRTHVKTVGWQVAAVLGLVAWNYGFTILLIYLLCPPHETIIVRTIALGITTVWNYLLYKIIFKNT